MTDARSVRYLQPMTISEILRPELKNAAEKRKAALRRSKMLKRFFLWVAVAVSCGVSGLSLGAVVGPVIFMPFDDTVASKQIDEAGRASEGQLAADGEAQSDAEESVAADSHSSTGSSTSSKSSGGRSSTPSSKSSGGTTATRSSNSSGGTSDTPEPSSFVLLAIGGLTLGGLAIRTRRRSRQ